MKDFDSKCEDKQLIARHGKQKMVQSKVACVEITCCSYFCHHRDILADEQVEKIVWGV